jgi:hypothetical protein
MGACAVCSLARAPPMLCVRIRTASECMGLKYKAYAGVAVQVGG